MDPIQTAKELLELHRSKVEEKETIVEDVVEDIVEDVDDPETEEVEEVEEVEMLEPEDDDSIFGGLFAD